MLFQMPSKTKALIMYLIAILCWSSAPVFIRYTKDYYPAILQTFFRYLVSLIILWFFAILSGGRGAVKKNFKLIIPVLPRILLIACANYCFQIAYTYAFYLLYPGFGALLNQSGIIFSVLLAVILFPDERPTLKEGCFLIGLILAVSGVVITILGGRDLGAVEFSLGIIVILIAAASWALFGALIKKWLPGISPSFSLSTVCTIVTPLFLLTYVLIYGGFKLPEAPVHIWLIMFISGLVGIGLGHSLYYRSVPVLGLSLSSSLTLLLPFFVGILSFLIFGERFSIMQFFGGALLISGSYFVIRVRFKHIS